MPPTRGISCLSLVLYGIRIGSEGPGFSLSEINISKYFSFIGNILTRTDLQPHPRQGVDDQLGRDVHLAGEVLCPTPIHSLLAPSHSAQSGGQEKNFFNFLLGVFNTHRWLSFYTQ